MSARAASGGVSLGLRPETQTVEVCTRISRIFWSRRCDATAFRFNGDHNRQVSGVAMGSKMGPSYTCLFVGFFEDQILSQYSGFIPQLYRRYIDDVVGAAYCAREDLD